MMKLIFKTAGWFCVLLGVVGPTAALYTYATRTPQVDTYFKVLRDYTALPAESATVEGEQARERFVTDSRAKAAELLAVMVEKEAFKLRAANPSEGGVDEQFIGLSGQQGGAE